MADDNKVDARRRVLDDAIASVEKTFGKGSVMRLGKGPVKKVDAYPTGIFSLDHILGIGGFPKGRIVEVYGPESSGKCVTGDTYVLSDDGWETIKECGGVSEDYELKIFQKELFGVNGKENSSHFYDDGLRKIKKITTRYGFSIKGTFEHPILIYSDGNFVFKKLKEIKEGDYACIQRGQNSFTSQYMPLSFSFKRKKFSKPKYYSYPSIANEDFARFAAYMIAEGSYGENYFVFTNKDEEIKRDFINLCKSLFGCTPKKPSELDLEVSSIYVLSFLQFYEICKGKSGDKVVPSFILKSPKSVQAEFIKTYADCDGSFFDGGIQITSASEELISQLQLMLLNFNIVSQKVSTICSATNGKNIQRIYWNLNITGKYNLEVFSKEIGFSLPYKQGNLENYLQTESRVSHNTNVNSIFFAGPLIRDIQNDLLSIFSTKSGGKNRKGKGVLSVFGEKICHRFHDIESGWCNLSYNFAREILEKSSDYHYLDSVKRLKTIYDLNFFFDPIVDVNDCKEDHVYDFVMPKTHSFTSNGFISHNTTLCLAVTAEIQKAGGNAMFIDVEHALDVSYAKALGVNVEELLISQPDYGEQALEIVETFVRSNAVDVIIVDSVAALVPRAEIEGEMGDAHVALQARLMSQALRKLTGAVSSSKTCLIFTNQLRDKIGVMFGNPEQTTGGNALKFYASVRIDVRRIGAVKEGDKVVANKTKIKIVKSKVSPPFRETEVEISFGKGFNKVLDIVEFSVKNGVIKQAGAWYNYKDSRFNGKTQLVDALSKDPLFFEAVKTDLTNVLNEMEK
jgi:recombination protein RecA